MTPTEPGHYWAYHADDRTPGETLQVVRLGPTGRVWTIGWDVDEAVDDFVFLEGPLTPSPNVVGAFAPGPLKPPTPSVPSPYGRCPACGSPGMSRERRIDGNDTCERGHVYPSREAVGP